MQSHNSGLQNILFSTVNYFLKNSIAIIFLK